jgi:hypothetical protein
MTPHPLFRSFIAAALNYSGNRKIEKMAHGAADDDIPDFTIRENLEEVGFTKAVGKVFGNNNFVFFRRNRCVYFRPACLRQKKRRPRAHGKVLNVDDGRFRLPASIKEKPCILSRLFGTDKFHLATRKIVILKVYND